MNDDAGGRRRWYVPDAYLPGDSSHGVESHESACLLNTGSEPAVVSLTFFFEDRDPVGPVDVTVASRRTRHVRLTDRCAVVGRRAPARRPVCLLGRVRRADRPPALAARHVCGRLHPCHDHRVWHMASDPLEHPEIVALVERSRRLGSDPRVTNFGGGNTSAKVELEDPITGELRNVLAVKGSGGDLGTLTATGSRSSTSSGCARSSASTRAPTTRTRWSACSTTPASARAAPFRRSTRRCTDFSRRPRRPSPSRRADRVRGGGRRARARRRAPSAAGSAGSTGSVRASTSACASATSSAAQPELDGVVARRPRASSRWADTSDESEALSLSLIEQAERYLAEQGRPDPFGAPRPGLRPLCRRRSGGSARRRSRRSCAASRRRTGTSSAG